jgi:hypothetical protein
MKFVFKPSLQSFKVVTAISLITFVFFYFLLIDGRYKSEIENLKRVVLYRDEFINELSGPKDMVYPIATNYKRKDWHDWKFIEYEKSRDGPGEQGKPFELSDSADIALNKKLFQVEGLFVIVSDKISVNRSVPDTRLPM